jgi:hypothetical protein
MVRRIGDLINEARTLKVALPDDAYRPPVTEMSDEEVQARGVKIAGLVEAAKASGAGKEAA